MIISKKNALIKEIKSLSDKKFRDRLGVFVIEGVKPVKEAILAGQKVRNVILTEKTSNLIGDGNYLREIVSDDVFSYVSEEVTPQGALAVVYKPVNQIKAPSGNCLLLDGVSDPANVGAIIRTAAASGFNDVYMTLDCADPYSQKAVRASMSGIFRVNVMRGYVDEILGVVSLPVWVADMHGKSIYQVESKGDVCLVVGNEGRGVSDLLKKRADFTVSIPMENGMESLNAAVSAGILMYCLKG